MSLAIVLGGWTAASILISPLIGRFLSAQDESKCRGGTRHMSNVKPSSSARPSRHSGYVSVRRNAAIQPDRREAGWPRAG